MSANKIILLINLIIHILLREKRYLAPAVQRFREFVLET